MRPQLCPPTNRGYNTTMGSNSKNPPRLLKSSGDYSPRKDGHLHADKSPTYPYVPCFWEPSTIGELPDMNKQPHRTILSHATIVAAPTTRLFTTKSGSMEKKSNERDKIETEELIRNIPYWQKAIQQHITAFTNLIFTEIS
ncbi:unnamed protein product [Arabidopsis arenosa]|uniref:Uncharacterized protein n=1 Tax=Arabidopsis arenosa TaxID=38785 RepID=A0A8S1ZZM3_ARAAE|nr:unnamed protein product [Arabidopsis arenosa]